MPAIWLSAICALTMLVLLLLGERTLPLFGGDREFAARFYKSVFMLLATGIVAGLIPAGGRVLAGFLRARLETLTGQEGLFAAWGRFMARHDIAGFIAGAAPILAAVIGIAGLVMAVIIWRYD